MPRRNSGPRLRWLDKRKTWYIFWTEGGRSRERSTCSADRGLADIAFAGFLAERQKRAGPREPNETLITDLLADYAEDRAPEVVAPDRIAFAIRPAIPPPVSPPDKSTTTVPVYFHNV